jgi:hypothetical protein
MHQACKLAVFEELAVFDNFRMAFGQEGSIWSLQNVDSNIFECTEGRHLDQYVGVNPLFPKNANVPHCAFTAHRQLKLAQACFLA